MIFSHCAFAGNALPRIGRVFGTQRIRDSHTFQLPGYDEPMNRRRALANLMAACTVGWFGSPRSGAHEQAITVLESKLFDLVNAERDAWGLTRLDRLPALSEVARKHSEVMAASKSVSHEVGGISMEQRIRAAAPDTCQFGENIAKNVSVDYAFSDLMESKGHRGNLLDPRFSQIGIGISRGSDGFLYVTQDFATPCAAEA